MLNEKGLSFGDPGELVTLEEMERRYIQHVLEASNGSRSVAAKTLGLDRTTLWRKLEKRDKAEKTDRAEKNEPRSGR